MGFFDISEEDEAFMDEMMKESVRQIETEEMVNEAVERKFNEKRKCPKCGHIW